MNRNHKTLFAAVLGACALLAIFFSMEKSDSTVQLVHERKRDASSTPPIKPAEIKQDEIKTQEVEEIFLHDGLKSQLGDIADYYESQSRYPVFSKPVTDPRSVEIPKPFEQTEVDSKLFDNDGELLPISISAAVDKFNYFVGETIFLRLSVSGLKDNHSIQAVATLKKLGGESLTAFPTELAPSGFTTGQLETRFETSALSPSQNYGEMIAQVEVQIGDELFSTTVPFNLLETFSARLENVAVPRLDGAFLMIPLEFSVSQPGYYFVQAYLYDQKTDTPLVKLHTEGQMQVGNDRLTLRAHYHALKDAGSSGPYTLKVFRAYRSAAGSQGEYQDVPASIAASAFAVSGFEFEDYEDSDYVDPEMQRRIAALRELGASSAAE